MATSPIQGVEVVSVKVRVLHVNTTATPKALSLSHSLHIMQQVGKHEPEKTDNTHALANTSTAMNERANELSLHIVYVWQAHVLKCEHACGLVQTTRQLICRARVCVCVRVHRQEGKSTERQYEATPNCAEQSRPCCRIKTNLWHPIGWRSAAREG